MNIEQHIRDCFGATKILKRKYLQAERDVQRTKWFDYRFMPAVEATRLFAETYTAAFQRKWRQYQDHDEADLKRPLKPLMTDRAEFTALWNARLKVDELGIPYPFFIDAAIEAAVGRNCRKFPRPNQLYADLNLRFIVSQWDEVRTSRVHHSKAPEYRSENYKGLPEQIDHQNWVLDQLRLVGPADYRIGTMIYAERVLLEANAIEAFGQERVERAKEAASPTPLVLATAPVFIRSCFALPGSFSRDECLHCAMASECERITQQLDKKMVEKVGCADGHLARTRSKTRERVRRHREKQKLLAEAV